MYKPLNIPIQYNKACFTIAARQLYDKDLVFSGEITTGEISTIAPNFGSTFLGCDGKGKSEVWTWYYEQGDRIGWLQHYRERYATRFYLPYNTDVIVIHKTEDIGVSHVITIKFMYLQSIKDLGWILFRNKDIVFKARIYKYKSW